MTEQQEHYDRYIARNRAFFERNGLSPPKLSEFTLKHKLFFLICRIIYAIEDSLSFLFGTIKLYYSFLASYWQRSDSEAAHDLHHGLQSLPDLLIYLAIGIPLVIIQILGTYLADSPDLNSNKYKFFIAKILAPFLRDILQGIKWAYKGIRSVLRLVFYFMVSHKEILLKILFPIAIAIAGLSLLNRIFLRSFRNLRKQKQSTNRKLALETLEEGHLVKFRQKIPTERKELDKLKKSLVYVPSETDGCTLYYVDKNSEVDEIDLTDEQKKHLAKQVHHYQSENIRRRIEPEFLSNNIDKLYFLEKLPENYLAYKRSLIFITNSALDKSDRLIYVDQDGVSKKDVKNSDYFLQVIDNEINNKTALNLYNQQINDLSKTINLHPNFELGLTIEEWETKKNQEQTIPIPAWRKFIYNKLKIKYEEPTKKSKAPLTLSSKLLLFCFLCVTISALIDGSYFYIGPIFMAAFNPAFFIAMLTMAIIMLIVCLVSRIYEEYYYQKVFKISQKELEVNTQKTEANIICKEIQKIIDLGEINEEELKKLKELTIKLHTSLSEYNKHHTELASLIRIKRSEAFLRGLRNGLSTQGVISAIMFAGVIIMLLAGVQCPPIFIIVMTILSFMAMFRSIYRYMQSYSEYKKHDVAFTKEVPNLIEMDADIIEMDYTTLFQNLNNLKNYKQEIEEHIIKKPPNLFEEENSEIIRLGCSGFSKAQKNFDECTLGEPRDKEDWWVTLTSFIFSGFMIGVFAARGTHKMYSAADENPNIVPNTEVTTDYSPKFFKFGPVYPKNSKIPKEDDSRFSPTPKNPCKSLNEFVPATKFLTQPLSFF